MSQEVVGAEGEAKSVYLAVAAEYVPYVLHVLGDCRVFLVVNYFKVAVSIVWRCDWVHDNYIVPFLDSLATAGLDVVFIYVASHSWNDEQHFLAVRLSTSDVVVHHFASDFGPAFDLHCLVVNRVTFDQKR